MHTAITCSLQLQSTADVCLSRSDELSRIDRLRRVVRIEQPAALRRQVAEYQDPVTLFSCIKMNNMQ